MVWVVFALMTAAAMLCVLWPLSRGRRGTARAHADLAFYRMQLAEVDRDVGRGLLADAEHASARTEVARRLLRASEQDEGEAAPASGTWQRTAAAGFALVAVPLVAFGLYARLGSPDRPDEPLQARLDAAPASLDIGVAVARIEAHLAAHPDDGRGYEILAPVYLQLGRADDAVRAAAKALELLGDTPDRRETYGEAMVAAAQGIVDAPARAVFEAVLKADPSRPKARYYLGLAAEQAGDAAGAISMFSQLIADSPDAAWVPMVRARIESLRGPAAQPAPAPGAAAAIASLSPAEQEAAIRGMVDRLAARLAQNGHDADGWLRLVRAYVVLKDADKAHTALADARRSLADDPSGLARLDDLAKQLGLGGS